MTTFRHSLKDTPPHGVHESLIPVRTLVSDGTGLTSILPRSFASLTGRFSFVLLLSFSFGLCAEVGAHAILVGSDPLHGAVLDEPPSQVLFRFNAAIEHAVTHVDLLDVNQTPTALRTVGSGVDRILAELPRLSPGVYTVVYKVLARDGHVSEGFIRFTIRGR